MAADSKTTELDDLAFQLFSAGAASNPARQVGEQEAIASYRKAEAFLAVREKIKRGELKPKEPEGVQLSDCCAPNLPRSHPINLVAKRWTDRKSGTAMSGDLNRVNKILRWLNANPTPEGDPQELVHRLGREFADLGWDLPTINVARAIFPAYAMSN